MNAPYFLNGTPWGPVGTIATLAAVTAPQSVVASRPGALSLFSRTIVAQDIAPNALEAVADPQVLSLTPTAAQNQPAAQPGEQPR